MRISSFLSQSSNKEMATGKMHIIPPWMFCYAVIRLYLEKLQQIEHDRRWKAEEIHMLDMCRNVLLDVRASTIIIIRFAPPVVDIQVSSTIVYEASQGFNHSRYERLE